MFGSTSYQALTLKSACKKQMNDRLHMSQKASNNCCSLDMPLWESPVTSPQANCCIDGLNLSLRCCQLHGTPYRADAWQPAHPNQHEFPHPTYTGHTDPPHSTTPPVQPILKIMILIITSFSSLLYTPGVIQPVATR